jgi:hypothetical protein
MWTKAAMRDLRWSSSWRSRDGTQILTQHGAAHSIVWPALAHAAELRPERASAEGPIEPPYSLTRKGNLDLQMHWLMAHSLRFAQAAGSAPALGAGR